MSVITRGSFPAAMSGARRPPKPDKQMLAAIKPKRRGKGYTDGGTMHHPQPTSRKPRK